MAIHHHPVWRPVALAASVSIAMAALSACGGGSEPSVAQVPTTPPSVALTSAAKYLVTVRDAATGALVTDATTVSFSGVAVVNLDNSPITSITVRDGMASFGTGAAVAAGARLTVRTSSRAAGWSDGSATVDVVASGDVRVINILVSNSRATAALNASAAPFVAAAVPAPTSGDGLVAATIAATTPAKTVTTIAGATEVIAPAGVSIPAGVRITNAAGQTPAGTLTLSITSPSTATADGLAATPGGARTADGRAVRVAGMVTTTLQDAAGNRFTRFSSPVTVQMPLAAGTRRLDRSGPLVPGDSYPVSVWNESTGRWDASTTGVVKAVGAGLVLEFATSSFSTRGALDIDPANPPEGSLRCDTGAVLLTGWPPTIGSDETVDIYTSLDGGNTFWLEWPYASFQSTLQDGEHRVRLSDQLFLPGQSRAATFKVLRSRDGLALATVAAADYCAETTVPMQFPPVPAGKVTVTVTEQCEDGSNSRPVRTTVSLTRPPTIDDRYSRVLSGYTDAEGRYTFTGLPSSDVSYDVAAEGTQGRGERKEIALLNGASTEVAVTIPFTMSCTGTTGSN